MQLLKRIHFLHENFVVEHAIESWTELQHCIKLLREVWLHIVLFADELTA